MTSWWKIAIWVGVVLLTIGFLYAVRSVLLPFVLAFVISALLDPTIRRLRTRGMSRGRAVALVFFIFFGLITVLIVQLSPIVSNQISNFREGVTYYTNQLAQQDLNSNPFVRWNPAVRARMPDQQTSAIDRMLEEYGGTLERLGLPSNRQAIMEQYIEPRRGEITQLVQNFFNGFLGILGTATSQILLLLFTPLFVYIILMDLERFKVRSASWIPPSIRAGTIAMLREIGEVFVRYLRGVTIVVAVYTVSSALLLAVLGSPYSILLGLLAGALYLIPFVGAWITGATIFLVIGLNGAASTWYASFSSPWVFALVVTGVYTVVSTVVFDNFVYPRLVGSSVGLHPLISMFVIFSGGALFGLIGMLLAFPLAGAVKVILERLLRVTSTVGQEGLGLPATPLRHRTASEM